MKKIQLMVLAFFLSLAFISCKKTSVNEETNSISQEQTSIQLWLTSQKVNNTTARVKLIDALGKNLLFDRLWVEKNNELQFIIVPVNETYKFSNNKGNKVSSYFVSVMRADSKILYSVIIQNRPINEQNGTAIKKGDIADIYSDKSVKEDCNVRFVTIYDYYLYEYNYKNNKLFSTLNLNKKPAANNSSGKQNNLTNLTGCIDWYLVTTYSNGTQTWEYVTTTCSGDCGVSNPDLASICPPDDTGGGGGGGVDPDPGTGVVKDVTYIVKEYQYGNQHWKIEATFKISGVKFNDIASNVFTSITHVGDVCWDYSGAYTNLPYMIEYWVFSSTSTSGLLSPTTASGSVTASMFYPNLPATYGGPRTDYYTLPHIWQASTALY
jgi:hypothetical protein